jgi:NAD(P)H-nitrite reductase large subunit
MLANLGREGGEVLAGRLAQKGIRIIAGAGVSGVARTANGRVAVAVAGHGEIDADICMVSVGYVRDISMAARAGLDTDAGIKVNDALIASAWRVLACGDVAQIGAAVGRCSVPEALAQGRVAGANACALSDGRGMQLHRPVNPPVILKYGGLELRAIGKPAAPGNSQKMLDGSDALNYRAVVSEEGIVVGVQMIGDCSQFEVHSKQIKETQS